MTIKRWFSTVLMGATFLAGCKKSEAVPITDVSTLPRQEAKLAPTAPKQPGAKSRPPRTVTARRAVQLAQAQPKEKSDPTEKPSAKTDDLGAKLLADLLRCSDAAVARLRQGPKKLPGPAAIEKPAPAAPRFAGLPARYPSKPASKTTPRDPSEGTPLAHNRAEPKAPEEIRFSIVALERWPSPDNGEPAALPIMAVYVADRASLVGPSMEWSHASALARAMPSRTTPLPFARFNLPDPFENRAPIRTTAIDSERTDPVVTTPRPLLK